MKKPDKIEQIRSLEAAIDEAIDDRRFFLLHTVARI